MRVPPDYVPLYDFDSLRHGDAIQVRSKLSAAEMFSRWKKTKDRQARLVTSKAWRDVMVFIDEAAVGKQLRKRTMSRNEIIKSLTKIFMAGDEAVQARIIAFRDSHGAARLRELKDEALPEAARLLEELKGA